MVILFGVHTEPKTNMRCRESKTKVTSISIPSMKTIHVENKVHDENGLTGKRISWSGQQQKKGRLESELAYGSPKSSVMPTSVPVPLRLVASEKKHTAKQNLGDSIRLSAVYRKRRKRITCHFSSGVIKSLLVYSTLSSAVSLAITLKLLWSTYGTDANRNTELAVTTQPSIIGREYFNYFIFQAEFLMQIPASLDWINEHPR